jgi:hypothetical protein
MATKKSVKPMPVLQVGDTAKWTSQAGGSTKTKEAKVVHVVPAGPMSGDSARRFIDSKVKAGTHRSAFGGGWDRPEVSYIMEVEGSSPKAKKLLYWPVANMLVKVNKNKGKPTGLPA